MNTLNLSSILEGVSASVAVIVAAAGALSPVMVKLVRKLVEIFKENDRVNRRNEILTLVSLKQNALAREKFVVYYGKTYNGYLREFLVAQGVIDAKEFPPLKNPIRGAEDEKLKVKTGYADIETTNEVQDDII